MKRKGFTLVEMLAVLAIMGLIIGIAIPSILAVRSSVVDTNYCAMIEEIMVAAQSYAEDIYDSEMQSSDSYVNIAQDVKLSVLVDQHYITVDNCEIGQCIVDPTDDSNFLDNTTFDVFTKNNRIYTFYNFNDQVRTYAGEKKNSVNQEKVAKCEASIAHREYVVSYNSNGGSDLKVDHATKIYGESFKITEEVPSRTNYSFAGWSNDSNATSATFRAGEEVVSDDVLNSDKNTQVNLYAVWIPKYYTITYHENGEDVSNLPGMDTKYYDTDLGVSAIVPIKDGFTFKGWSLSNDGEVTYNVGDYFNSVTDSYVGDAAGTIKNLDLYAVWEEDSYTLTYDSLGGDSIPSQNVTYLSAVTISSTIPTRVGYTFLGWATTNGGSVSYTAGSVYKNAKTLDKLFDATLYAVWKENTTTITYNLNGGDGSISSTTMTYADSAYITSTKPTRTNYLFLGWSTSKTAKTPTYASGSLYKSSNTNKDNVTLYAVWFYKIMTVTFNLNGGSSMNGMSSTKSVTYGEAYGTLPSPTISDPKTKFAGWYTAASGGTRVYSSTKVSATGDHTLYAHWTSKTRYVDTRTESNTMGPGIWRHWYGTPNTFYVFYEYPSEYYESVSISVSCSSGSTFGGGTRTLNRYGLGQWYDWYNQFGCAGSSEYEDIGVNTITAYETVVYWY